MKPAALEDLDWGQDAREAIEAACTRGGSFTADDLREAGLRDAPIPNMWGAAFKAASRAGIIRHAGWTISRRPQRRNSVTALWLPVQPTKAPANTAGAFSLPGDNE